MRYRVDQLASAAEVSVDTVRFYQARGLLAAPLREGRVAWYDDDHLERLRRIRGLQAKGLTLAVIRRLLAGELDAADEALAAAVHAGSGDGQGDADRLTVEQLAERSGIPLPVLRALEREHMLIADQDGYTVDDLAAARAGLRLLEQGLPLPELLELARAHHAAMRAVATRAVDLFDAHVRQPLRVAGVAPEEAAARLVEAFREVLPATTTLVAHHFTRTLLAVAQEHIEAVGEREELDAVRAASP